jgi:hypothetical protein
LLLLLLLLKAATRGLKILKEVPKGNLKKLFFPTGNKPEEEEAS